MYHIYGEYLRPLGQYLSIGLEYISNNGSITDSSFEMSSVTLKVHS